MKVKTRPGIDVTGTTSIARRFMNFSTTALTIYVLWSLVSCEQKHDHEQHQPESSPNQALYDQVMGIHDEVMPKMNDLYKAKKNLQTRLELPGLGEKEKQDISAKIARIDSASEGMMVWMRQFNPIPDSVGEEKARAYLNAELVKVKKVKEDILEALKGSDLPQ